MSAHILHHRAERSFDLAEVKAVISGAICLLSALHQLGEERDLEAEAIGAVADMLIPARQFFARDGRPQPAPRSPLAPDGEAHRAIGAAICILSALQSFQEDSLVDPAAVGAVAKLLAPVLVAIETAAAPGAGVNVERAA